MRPPGTGRGRSDPTGRASFQGPAVTRGICSLRSRRTGAGVEGCDGEYSGGWKGGSLASLRLSFCPGGWGAALYSEWRDVGPDAGQMLTQCCGRGSWNS